MKTESILKLCRLTKKNKEETYNLVKQEKSATIQELSIPLTNGILDFFIVNVIQSYNKINKGESDKQ